jgi:hypothetical protein
MTVVATWAVARIFESRSNHRILGSYFFINSQVRPE